MPAVKVKLKGIHAVKANGCWYYYVGRDRDRKRLTAAPGTAEFVRQYHEAIDPLSGADRKRLAFWIAKYKASDGFRKLAMSTHIERSRWLDRIQDHFGALSVAQFDRPQFRLDIRRWRDKWKETPRAADYAKQSLSALLTFIVAEGALGSNICFAIPNLYTGDRADKIWTPDDLAVFTASEHTSEELAWAARLASLTALRRDDLIRLAWSHVGSYAIEMKTGKSRRKRSAVIPVTKDLRSLLGEIPRRAVTVLTSSRKRPWTNDGFGSSWNTAIGHTTLAEKDLHLHDLRGTAATNFYRAGLTSREIAEILAWSEDRVERLIDRYVKRDEIMKDRIRRLEAAG